MKTPNKISDSSGRGCECYYFSNGDGTGWKVYRNKGDATLAWASQIWAVRKDIAPLVLSGIKELSLDFPPKSNYKCPVSDEYIDLVGNKYVLDRFDRALDINCSQYLIELCNKDICYGFLTEEVESIGLSSQYEHHQYFHYKLSSTCGDCHSYNWGITGNRILFLDFGNHFSRLFSEKQKKEIEKIMKQA
jgi:hypothetical protein